MSDDMATTLSKAIGEIARLPKSSIKKVRIGQDDTDGFEIEWRADLISFRLTYDPATPELSLRLVATISSPGENTADVSEGATVREALDDIAAKRKWQAEHIRELLGQNAVEAVPSAGGLAGFRAVLVSNLTPRDSPQSLLNEFDEMFFRASGLPKSMQGKHTAAAELAMLKARLGGFRAYLTEEARLDTDIAYVGDDTSQILSEFDERMNDEESE